MSSEICMYPIQDAYPAEVGSSTIAYLIEESITSKSDVRYILMFLWIEYKNRKLTLL